MSHLDYDLDQCDIRLHLQLRLNNLLLYHIIIEYIMNVDDKQYYSL